MSDSIPMKELLVVTAPLFKTIVDTFVTPKLESFKKRFSLDHKKHRIPLEDHLCDYLARTYERVSTINTLVFNNSPKLLKDIYLPLTISGKGKLRNRKFKIGEHSNSLLKSFNRILITDIAGMGKSTLIKKLFLDILDHQEGVPILVELRRLHKDKKIIDEIKEQVDNIEKDFNKELLLELISEGDFIILLDGYDEIPISDRESVTMDIQSFIAKGSKNKFVLTSRPENALASFGDFPEFYIQPLKREDAFRLLKKYDAKGKISSLLIKKLKETGMSNISEFLTNPLLVTLLFTAFQYKQTIPFKKNVFYRQVYDAYFDSHDLTKGDSFIHNKFSKLESDDFHRVLRHIGYACLKDNQRIEFNKDEILLLIEQAKSFCVNLQFKASDFLKDLLVTVPLFTQDGIYYRWMHKSLQEYFAAQFIFLDAKDQQSKILDRLYNSKSLDKYINILDLYFDIDSKTFRKVIIYDYLQKFKDHFDSSFKSGFSEIETKDLNFRKEISFLRRPFLFTISFDNNLKDSSLGRMIKDLRPENITGAFTEMALKLGLVCFSIDDRKEDMSRLLAKKIPHLFDTLTDNSNSTCNIKHSLNTPHTPHFLNEKADDEFNSPVNFKNVNRLLVNSRMDRIKINSSEAFKLLAEIEDQIKAESPENFLLDGLAL